VPLPVQRRGASASNTNVIIIIIIIIITTTAVVVVQSLEFLTRPCTTTTLENKLPARYHPC